MNPTTEPVRVGAAVLAATQAALAALVGLELVHWTPEQIGLVQALLVAVVALVAVVVRSRVTPVPPT